MLISHIINTVSAPNAYIDPNTGGMLFQLLAIVFATFSGILFFFSRQIKTGMARFRRTIRGESSEENESTDQDQEQDTIE